jgi:anti-sigma regulatory factor (Ser/Thr protein kinase)
MTRAGATAAHVVPDEGPVAVIDNEVLDLEVPVRRDAVAAVRHAVVQHLARGGVPSTIIDDVELVTSELVTNAIIHPRRVADAAIDVHVALSDVIEVVVANVGSAATIPPVEQWLPAPPYAPSGRGLGIVWRLCDHVTISQSGDRAVVTCRRRLPDGGATP